jgi:hypothetical protein
MTYSVKQMHFLSLKHPFARLKTKAFYPAMVALGLVSFGSRAWALPVDLGAAGNFAVLEIGNGNVSIANASNAGSITGNLGVNGGSLSDSGTPITGNVVTSANATVNPNVAANVSGTISQDSASLASATTAAESASSTAAGLASSGGGVGVSSIVYNNAGTIDLNPGVYNLTNLQLNGTILDLTAGADYVFNISGQLSLNSSEILDSTGADVLFNITGTQGVQLAGGLNNESVLDGIILAPDAQISETPGNIVGEIISGQNINIASGAKIQGPTTTVPDSGSTLALIGIGCLGLCMAGKLTGSRMAQAS